MNNLTDSIGYNLQQYAAMTQAQLLNSQQSKEQQQDPTNAGTFSLGYQPFPVLRMAPPHLHQPTLAQKESLSLPPPPPTSLEQDINERVGTPIRVTRPPNAYLLFNKEMRRILKKEDPTMKVAEISKEVGHRWKNMPQEQKDQYVAQANKLKEEQRALHPNSMYIRRSRAELIKAGHFVQRRKKGNNKKAKNSMIPKHPLSAYMWYLTEARPGTMREHPGSNVGQISKLCADRWHAMSEQDRLPWQTKAIADKERYAREMQGYAIQNDHALGRGTRQKYRNANDALMAQQFYSNKPSNDELSILRTLPIDQHTLNPNALLQHPSRE